mmetsp:Transcript_21480/g.36898  ORF Transcript_21480/g.36898 Transcript_21480/m.36898 type:complete len:147 (-) Transcript_21480:206-646(-)
MNPSQQDNTQEKSSIFAAGSGRRAMNHFSRLLFQKHLLGRKCEEESTPTCIRNDTRPSCHRQSSLPTLPTMESSMPPTDSIDDSTITYNSSTSRTSSNNSYRNSTTSYCSTTSRNSQSSTQSGIQSSWEERKRNRRHQQPNPFAFY